MATRTSRESSPADKHDDVLPYRLDFAQHCFANAQQLTSLIDQKAVNLLTIVGILTAAYVTLLFAAGFLALDVAALKLWVLAAAGLLAASFLAYLLVTFLIVSAAGQVFFARPPRSAGKTPARGLIFPLMVLRYCRDDERVYAESLTGLTPADILREYANQIVEVSAIYQEKQDHLNRAVALFRWHALCWMVGIVVLIAFAFLQHANAVTSAASH